MDQEAPSFWADIKKYEDTLEKDPNSYCFAPLSELYRKLGMVDDAISVAKRGCELHPDYIGGYMALGRAYHDKGMNAESKEALERVVKVTPENLLAQRILSKLYIDAGDIESAKSSLNAILMQIPDDTECSMLLGTLEGNSSQFQKSENLSQGAEQQEKEGTDGGHSSELLIWDESEDVIELDETEIIVECLEERKTEETDGGMGADIVFEDFEEDVPSPQAKAEEKKDPLTTVTLADLYMSQGFPEKALAIYRELLVADPDNVELKEREAAILGEMNKDEPLNAVTATEGDLVWDEFLTEDKDDSELALPTEAMEQEIYAASSEFSFSDEGDEALPIIPEGLSGENLNDTTTEIPTVVTMGQIPQNVVSSNDDEVVQPGSDEQVIRTLEIWLENIKRRR